MAYTPTLADFPQDIGGQVQGYQPTLADMPSDSGGSSMPFGQRLGADFLSGLAQMGHGLLNAPHNLVNMVSSGAASYIPTQADHDFSGALGIPNPNFGDKLVQGAGQYLPYLLGGEAALTAKGIEGAVPWATRLANSGQTGAVFGATQSNDPVSGAALGGATNIGFGLLGRAAGMTPDLLKGYLSRFAAPGLVNSIGSDLNTVKNMTNSQAFDMAKSNYQNYTNAEKSAWDSVTDQAKQADASGATFDNKPYLDSLASKLANLQDQSGRQSAYNRANAAGSDMLGGYLGDQHGTFTDAVEHNKALNQDYQNEITPGKSLPFNIVNYAKSNIKQTLNDNINNNGLQDGLGEAWNSANQLTSQKNQIFNQVSTPKGRDQISTFSQVIKPNSDLKDPTGFVNDYLPSARGDGIQKMQQFSSMLGNEESAKNILKMNYFGDSFTGSGSGVDANAFIKKYNNLSQDQQGYLFNQNQNNVIKSLGKVLENHPDALKRSSMAAIFNHSMPGLIGMGLGHLAGYGALEGGMTGFLAGNAAKVGMNKLFQSPGLSNYIVNHLSAPARPYGNSYLGTALGASVAPQLINQGNQQQ